MDDQLDKTTEELEEELTVEALDDEALDRPADSVAISVMNCSLRTPSSA